MQYVHDIYDMSYCFGYSEIDHLIGEPDGLYIASHARGWIRKPTHGLPCRPTSSSKSVDISSYVGIDAFCI